MDERVFMSLIRQIMENEKDWQPRLILADMLYDLNSEGEAFARYLQSNQPLNYWKIYSILAAFGPKIVRQQIQSGFRAEIKDRKSGNVFSIKRVRRYYRHVYHSNSPFLSQAIRDIYIRPMRNIIFNGLAHFRQTTSLD